MDRETAHQIRGMVTRGVMRAANDGGAVQTADVTTHRGISRTGIEVMQPFGFSSTAPAGGTVVLFAVGGDQGDLVALPVGSPACRLGALGPGDSALYSSDGSRIMTRADGRIEVVATQSVSVRTRGVEAWFGADRMRVCYTSGTARLAADAQHIKIARGDDVWLALTDAGIVASHPVVIGPDPNPAI